MGKTTLCKTIMGLVRATSGSIRFGGEDLLSLQPAQIARLGIGYVPQGRRLWRSLTVDEHLRMIAGRGAAPGRVERIYDTFPRLAERKNNGGGQLSGGEQQMLAISRALLTNPRLLVMDEPTEGLAPVIVAQVEEMLVRLAEEGEIAVLVIEQNIGVATAVSENVAIMVNGRVNRMIESRASPPTATCSSACSASAAIRSHDRDQCGRRRHERRGALGSPRPPSLGADPRLHLQPDAADALVAAGAGRAHRGRRADRSRAACCGSRRPRGRAATPAARASSGPPAVLVAGTLDTKGEELRFIRDIVAGSGLRTRLVDLSTSGKPSAGDVSAQEIALNHPRGGSAVFDRDRGASVAAMAEAFETWMRRQTGIAGIISRRRLGRRLAGGARHARAADRRAEAHDLHRRLGRRRAAMSAPPTS